MPEAPPTVSPLASHLLSVLKTIENREISSFLVACSAGPDSVALVRAFKEAARYRSFRVEIGHVNHCLRGRESDRDERFVRALGVKAGLRVHSVRRPLSSGGGNQEERARDLRYAALGAIAKRRRLGAVAFAHTADDQAETVFMNLLRGSALDGLGGMKPVRPDERTGIMIVRPFLAVSRADVRSRLRRKDFRVDRSNSNLRFLRNYVRLKLFSLLQRRSPDFQKRIARTAEIVRDEAGALAKAAEQAFDRISRRKGNGILVDQRVLAGYPVAIQRRVLRRASGKDLLTFEGVERLRNWMASPPTSGRIWQLRKGWIVERLSKARGSSSPSLFWFQAGPLQRKWVKDTRIKKRTLIIG